jgi:integrase
MPVYHDKKRNTYYISASYTVRKGVYKKLVRRGFKRKKDAIRMERILMANIEDSVRKINNMSLILDDLWNDYLNYMKLTGWKEKTAATNTSKYKKHIQPVFGQRNVLQIEKKEIVDFHTKLINQGLCKSSVNGIHAVFSGLYSYINDVYDIDYHPLSKVGFVKFNHEDKKKEIVILETDDFIRFVNAVEGTKMKLIFRTFYSTGLRISELQNLKWTDFKKKSLYIHKITKSKNSYRIVPIDQELNKLLTEFKEKCSKEDTYTSDAYIFFGKSFKEKIPDYKIREILEKTLDACGLKRMTPHDFRHTFVSLLIDAGYDDTTIAEVIGDSVSTVRTVYAHMLPKRRKSITEFIDSCVPKINISV